MRAAVFLVVLAGLPTCEAQAYYEVTASSSGYRFNGSALNPTITLTKGQTYGGAAGRADICGIRRLSYDAASPRPTCAVFNLTAKTHPFRVIGNTASAYVQAVYNNFSECGSCVSADDVRYGRVVFTVPTGTTSPRIGYTCSVHPALLGNFTLINPTPSQTPSPSATPSNSASASQSQTLSAAVTPSQSVSPSLSPTASQGATASPSETPSQVRLDRS